MNPLSVTCTTCQARLRVRDPSAVGQILTCPKCGSMVLVESGFGGGGGGGGVEGPSAGDALPAVRPPPRPRPAAPTGEPAGRPAIDSVPETSAAAVQAGDLADTVEDLTQYGIREVAAPRAQPQAPGAGEPVLSTAQDEALPDVDGSLAAAARRRRWIPGILAGAAGVGLAVMLFVWVAGRGASPVSQGASPPVAVEPPVVAPASEATDESSLPDRPADTGLLESSGLTASPQPEPLPPGPRTFAEEPEARPTEPLASTPSDAVPPGKPDWPRPADTTPAPAAPIELDITSGEGGGPAGKTALDSLSDTLRRLGGMFDPDTVATAPAVPGAAEVPPASDPAVEPPARPVRAPRPAPRQVDVAARLNDPILEVQLRDTPLRDFLQFASDYSTIPITLEPEALMWLGISPATPVTIAARDTTVAQLLDQVLATLGLTYQAADQQLVVTYKSSSEGNRRVKLNVADLVADGSTSVDDLLQHVRALIAPGTWDDSTGGGHISADGSSLVVQHASDVLFQVIVFCEKLRVARGMSLRSKFNPKYFQLSSRIEQARPRLQTPVTLNFARPTLLTRVINRISKETGLLLIVDWQAVAYADWNPDAEVTYTVANTPAGEALDALLAPLELTYRIVDEETVQITTPLAVEERLELELYKAPSFAKSPGDGPEKLKALLGALPGEWLKAGGGKGEIRYDAASQCLLVALPQPRQREFQKWLAALVASR